MSRKEAHERWGHPHLVQLNRMARHCKVNVYGTYLNVLDVGLSKAER